MYADLCYSKTTCLMKLSVVFSVCILHLALVKSCQSCLHQVFFPSSVLSCCMQLEYHTSPYAQRFQFGSCGILHLAPDSIFFQCCRLYGQMRNAEGSRSCMQSSSQGLPYCDTACRYGSRQLQIPNSGSQVSSQLGFWHAAFLLGDITCR